VDLVWRLNRAGWRIRFDPSVEAEHREPETWSKLLNRRFRYGTSAAPLSKRHPGAVAPLVLHLWPTLVVLSLLAKRPALAATLFVGQLAALRSRLSAADIPNENLVGPSATGVYETWRGIGHYCTQFASPALAAAIVLPRAKRSHTRRIAAAPLLVGPALAKYFEARPKIDPARFVAIRIADDVAYGTGVWLGCIQQRTLAPLKPRLIPTLKRND
ncbi:MAG: mycofactocin system glycosyltransferase, partial [Acidimicrobiales bacterium]